MEKRAEAKEAFLKECDSNPRIVIDCSFDKDLTDKELKSLTQQIMHCHAYNKKTSHPSHLHITGYGSRLESRLSKI
eukprot:27072-Eustigmatos_ZCMA.PRE.1